GVAMDGADHDVFTGNIGSLADLLARGLDDFAWNVNEIQRYERGFDAMIFEHEGLGMERIVNSFAEPHIIVAGHRNSYGRRDIHGRAADAELRSRRHGRQQ